MKKENEVQQNTKIPLCREISFPESSCHNRGITALTLDKHSGTQMLTGSDGDYIVKMWDM